MTASRSLGTAIAAISLAMASIAAHAQTPAEFYRGKQIRMIIGHPVGGDYDLGGRLLAKHLTRHIPANPAVVVQNLPGAASIQAANMLYNTAPKDGTVFGSFSRNLPSQSVVGHPSLQLDMRRFEWLGVVSRPSRVCVSWHTSKVKRADDVFKQELIVPGGGASSGQSIVPMILNYALDTKFRIVEGYRLPDGLLAMQRGEVDGICMPHSIMVDHQEWIRDSKINVLF
jgi:tripartite-type tricarboxylate transporter receptor subunit TctC